MTSQAIAKNISTLSKEVLEKQVTPVDVQNKQVDNDFTLVEFKKNIKKINLEDFPTPGSVILTKEQEKEIFDSNRMSCTRKIQLEPAVTDPRTIAFNHMADKDKVAKTLSCTKACRNIKMDPETRKFGVCYRAYCTFAHSMDELQPALCSFDNVCHFKHGRIIDRNTRTIAQGSKCKFRHSDETINQYYARSGMTCPDLPMTNEETRKIQLEQPKKQPKEEVKVPVKKQPKEEVKVPVKKQPKEEVKVPVKEQPKEEVKEQPKEQQVSRRSYDSDMSSDSESSDSESSESSDSESSESSDSESSESETEEETRRHLKKERKARKSKKSSLKNDIQVIRVPTKELAKIALKAAFDRGQFNVQVLIE